MTSTSEPSLIVHHLNDSRSQRILWLLEELEVPYTIKHYQRQPDQRAPKELQAIHPLGKAPLITDGNITVAESGAIVDYIIYKYGKSVNVSPENRLDDVYWSHAAEGSIMPYMVMKIIFTVAPKQVPWLLWPIVTPVCAVFNSQLTKPALAMHARYIEEYLEKHKGSMWFAHGDGPTSADYMMLFPLEAYASGMAGEDGVGPRIKEWVATVQARPAYKRALEKGGPYFLA